MGVKKVRPSYKGITAMKCAKFECVFWIIYRYFIILTYRVQLKTNLYCPPHKKKKENRPQLVQKFINIYSSSLFQL